jgi:hypothetical protein
MSFPSNVIPGVDLPELLDFYTATVTGVVITEDQHLSGSGKGADVDAKGQQLVQFMVTGANRVFVWRFVQPIEDGGLEVPIIASREAYVTAHLGGCHDLLQSLRGTFPLREKHMLTAQGVYEESAEVVSGYEQEQADLEQPDPVHSFSTPEEETAYKATVEEYLKEATRLEGMLFKANEIVDRNYCSWMGHHAVLQKDKQKVHELEVAATKAGSDQHSRDTAALGRLRDAMEKLKSFLRHAPQV